MPLIRPMREEDADAALALSVETFSALDARTGQAPEIPPPNARLRYTRLIESDPAGAWIAEEDGALTACAIAILRDGLWGLSLLVVRPDRQSSGLGREILARAVDYAAGARGRVILSSPDPRAIRAYARLGLHAHPCFVAEGIPRAVRAPASVREGGLADLPLTDAVDRHVRGAAHGADIATLLELNAKLLVVPDRGYAVIRNGSPRLLAASDADAARDLLRATLADAGDGPARVEWLSALQPWAIEVCVEARLELSVNSGAVFTGGDVRPFTPYLPSGAFL